MKSNATLFRVIQRDALALRAFWRGKINKSTYFKFLNSTLVSKNGVAKQKFEMYAEMKENGNAILVKSGAEKWWNFSRNSAMLHRVRTNDLPFSPGISVKMLFVNHH